MGEARPRMGWPRIAPARVEPSQEGGRRCDGYDLVREAARCAQLVLLRYLWSSARRVSELHGGWDGGPIEISGRCATLRPSSSTFDSAAGIATPAAKFFARGTGRSLAGACNNLRTWETPRKRLMDSGTIPGPPCRCRPFVWVSTCLWGGKC